jgi:hypothetical protein
LKNTLKDSREIIHALKEKNETLEEYDENDDEIDDDDIMFLDDGRR